jgi:4-amino-4-deoxychorismate lyase
MKAWINGITAQAITIQDRGLAYGDGFFTTLLVKQHTPIHWTAHWQRLDLSAQRLGFPKLDPSILWSQLTLALAEANDGLNVIKIIITRGVGGQGYTPPHLEDTHPNILIQLLPFPMPGLPKNSQAWPEFQLKVVLSQIQLSHQTHLLAGLKHLNRLENVLARQALPTFCEEAVMMDEQQQVISGTQANLVVLKNQVLYTPDLGRSGVQGTFLTALAQYAMSIGYQFKVKSLCWEDLITADELWMCNAVRGVMPIIQLEQQSFNIQQGQKVNQQIQTLLWEAACKN